MLVYIYRFSYPILIPSLLKNRGLEFRRFTHNGINISEHNHHTQHTHMHHTHMHHTHTTQINVIYIYRLTRTEMKCAKKVLLYRGTIPIPFAIAIGIIFGIGYTQEGE